MSGFTDRQIEALRLARSRAAFGLYRGGLVRTADDRCPLAVASGVGVDAGWQFQEMRRRLGFAADGEVASIVGAADIVSHPLRGELLRILGLEERVTGRS